MKRYRFLATALVSVGLIFGLTGCFLIEGPQPEEPPRPKVEMPKQEPKFYPDGDATQNKDYFVATLLKYSESDEELSSQGLSNAIIEAGFAKETVEVSTDQSVTNLPTDTVTVATRFDQECLLGQIERKTGEVFVFQTETVGPDKDICLIGNTATL